MLCVKCPLSHPFLPLSLPLSVCVFSLMTAHNSASSACWMWCDLLLLCMCMCACSRVMLFVYLQYPGVLYIAPNRVWNSIWIVFQGHSTLCCFELKYLLVENIFFLLRLLIKGRITTTWKPLCVNVVCKIVSVLCGLFLEFLQPSLNCGVRQSTMWE